jgi:hypothetical protein
MITSLYCTVNAVIFISHRRFIHGYLSAEANPGNLVAKVESVLHYFYGNNAIVALYLIVYLIVIAIIFWKMYWKKLA